MSRNQQLLDEIDKLNLYIQDRYETIKKCDARINELLEANDKLQDELAGAWGSHKLVVQKLDATQDELATRGSIIESYSKMHAIQVEQIEALKATTGLTPEQADEIIELANEFAYTYACTYAGGGMVSGGNADAYYAAFNNLTDYLQALVKTEPVEAEQPEETADAKRLRWQTDPVAFVDENLPSVTLYEEQKEVLRSLVNNRKTRVKLGNGAGKTFLCALASLWYAECFDDALVIVASSTFNQLKNQLWDILADLSSKTEITKSVRRVSRKQLSWECGDSQVLAVSVRNEHSIGAIHWRKLLVVLDNADSMPDYVDVAVSKITRVSSNRILRTETERPSTTEITLSVKLDVESVDRVLAQLEGVADAIRGAVSLTSEPVVDAKAI